MVLSAAAMVVKAVETRWIQALMYDDLFHTHIRVAVAAIVVVELRVAA